MRPRSLQLARIVLGWLIGLSALPLAAPADPPTPTPAPLDAVQLRVLLRASTGQPIPGIAVDLVPVPPDLGGPSAGTPAQHGQTDTTGVALFAGLQGAVWRMTFTGSYTEQPLQSVADQGQPPYGTTHGGGFVVQTSLHEENDAPAPVVGVPAPPVETLVFVLLPTNGRWIPAIDLAAPTDPPQPFNLLAPTPMQPQFYRPAAQQPLDDPPVVEDKSAAALDEGFTALWLVPAIAAGAALWRVWQARHKGKHSMDIGGKRADAVSDRGST